MSRRPGYVYGDSPEQIERCLHCKRTNCVDCVTNEKLWKQYGQRHGRAERVQNEEDAADVETHAGGGKTGQT